MAASVPSQHQGNGARPRSVSPKVEFSPTTENQEGVRHNPSLLICLSSHLSLLWLSGGRRTILEIDQCSKFQEEVFQQGKRLNMEKADGEARLWRRSIFAHVLRAPCPSEQMRTEVDCWFIG